MTRITTVCVYCGSAEPAPPAHVRAAQDLGRSLAERGITTIFGGGRVGMMGHLADAALAAGGKVIGIIPRHLEDVEVGHTGVSDLRIVSSMHERKEMMASLADAFIVLPGGLGTLDETLEILTWRQLGLHDNGIILLDVDGYWRPLNDLIHSVVAQGYAAGSALDLFHTATSVAAALDLLEHMEQPAAAALTERM
ncbi:MAG: TIGR00730 family Rossman fold protein [Alphaproteobacteria bacterium]